MVCYFNFFLNALKAPLFVGHSLNIKWILHLKKINLYQEILYRVKVRRSYFPFYDKLLKYPIATEFFIKVTNLFLD